MKDNNCIFCKLANGDIPTNTVYEDADFRVFLDGAPAAKGHCLVVPKNHFANAFEIDEETIGKGAAVAKKVAMKMKEALGCDGVNILQNNGEAAGQTVFHYHVHVIPRFAGDTDRVKLTWKQGENSAEDVAEMLEKLGM